MKRSFKDIVNMLEAGPLQKTCDWLADQAVSHEPFGLWPASLSHHHAYPGGLVAHTTEVANMAVCLMRSGTINSYYLPEVIAACLWHDYGKISEYELIDKRQVPEGRRTLPFMGMNLVWTKKLGIPDGSHPHIQWSADTFVQKAAQCGLARDCAERVENMILSHHGRPEWGSEVEPSGVGWVVHMADMLSAKIGTTKSKP